MQMVKEEWKHLISQRWMRIVMFALIFIPSLYAVIFLASLWDSYGRLSDLPVAVVNQDKTATLNGTKTNVGDRLVKNLHKNHGLKWKFLDTEAEADKGLKDGKYYMVLTIPKNFSKNSGTVLNDNPKHMNLKYKTAAGHSYIGEKMTTSAVTKLQDKVANEVTETYAKTMFDAIKSAGAGMKKASDGAGKLDKGTTKLIDGDKTLTDGLKTLSTSTLTFKNGAKTLQTGLNQYIQGVDQVDTGAQTLSTGLDKYAAGVGKLNTGAQTLNTGVTKYTNGVKQVYNGASSLSDGLIKLRDGSTQLAGGMDLLNAQLNASAAKIDALSGELTQGQTELKQAQTAFNKIDASMSDLLNKTDKNGELNQLLTATEQLQTLVHSLSEDEDINSLKVTLGDNLTPMQRNKIDGVIKNMENRQKTINQITNDLDTIRTTVDGLTGGSGTSVAGYVNAARTTIQTKLDNLTTALNEGQSSLTQFKQLQAGVAQLTTASHTLNNGLITATNSQNLGKLVTGIGTLNKSSSALNSGASQLASGTGQLNASSGQLTSGASTLAAGTAKLASKGGALQSGANQLGSAAGQLSSGADKLYDGGQTLGNGLDTLGEGTTALHDQLDKGAKKVQKLKATPKTYKMMSAPVDLKHKETAKVDNNGTGMAPYMISVGLFVGGLTFTIMYDLYSPRRYPDKGRRWWFSKASVVAVMAVLQSIAIIGLLMAVDGLNPIHPWATLGVTMLTAFAFLSLISLFAVALGKVGSFIMLVFMVLQLSGSAGTYPIQLSNGFFEAIHPWLPMTYSIDALRNTISIGGPILGDVIFLVGLLVISNLLWLGFYFVKHLHYRFSDDGTWYDDSTGILNKIR